MLSNLVCLGRHTVTGLLCTSGRQFHDWSADYRMYSGPRFQPEGIFGTVLSGVLGFLKPLEPLVTAMDDSLMRKCGKRTPGVSYRRDPMGPPFSVNLITAQRFLQLSAAALEGTHPCAARMIPVDFTHAPSPKKPRRSAPKECLDEYLRLKRAMSINRLGAERLHHCRKLLDKTDPQRPLWVTVDGRFTNGVVLKNLPEKTTIIGRIRGDAKLHYLPEAQTSGPGRKRIYGDRAPTPDELRRDQAEPWTQVPAFACGKIHNFKVKTLGPLRWRSAGRHHDLKLIVIAPLGYRLSKGSRLMYRRPAYLICTDPTISVEKILQAYIWRWDIEVNFRDEKQLIGVGQAQVRNQNSVQSAPAMAVASYAILLLAAEKGSRDSGLASAPSKPRWRSRQPKRRQSTGDLISQLRAELLAEAISDGHFSGFLTSHVDVIKPEKYPIDFKSALVYATA
ncbi:MAG: transposase [Dehalococcoidia bacterium]